MRTFSIPRAIALCAVLFVAACGEGQQTGPTADERGPHNGRVLREGDLALEVTVFEAGVPPEFHIYPSVDNKPVDPRQVKLEMSVSRLGGKVERFAFQPRENYLRATAPVAEPHSFDISIAAEHAGKKAAWQYASYEGRTTIPREIADAAGIKVAAAGPAVLAETVDATGRIELLPEGRAEVRAWYPGRIIALPKYIGDPVRKGEIIARVESADSLQTYGIPAPFDGVVAERIGNVGGVAGDAPLYVVVDNNQLHAELSIFPQDAARVKVEQPVRLTSASGGLAMTAPVEALLPRPGGTTPVLIAHVHVPPEEKGWYPGMGVSAAITVGRGEVPLAVKTQAIQRFRNFQVVYARVGDTYEVRVLTLGRQTPEWTEVTGGLMPGETYVTDNAFLVRADVEKSSAVHDH